MAAVTAPALPAGSAPTTASATSEPAAAPGLRPVVRGRGKAEARAAGFEPGEEEFFKGD
jgi:hypothetical protein